MANQIIKLSFKAPVHFGNGRLADSAFTCDSATLFSALYIEALRMGCADDFFQAVKAGDILFSDAFPYIGDQLYIPKPMAFPKVAKRNFESGDSRERKANKKLKYIPFTLLSSYFADSFDFIEEQNKFELGKQFLRTKVNLTRENSDDAEPFHVGAFAFNPGCGIYFIATGTFDVAPLFEQLSYSGLGGKRSSGYGRFSVRFENSKAFDDVLVDSFSNSKGMLLSTSIPCEEELTESLLSNAKYHLERKGGFVQSTTHASTFRKKRDMWMFTPGSVFENSFKGDVFNVNATPDAHAVYRYARAMWMEV